MLPKVATHILHSTVTRSAAAAVHNQANLRNVLQLHPSSPGSSSSSSLTTSNAPSSGVSTSKAKANTHGGSNGPHSGDARKDKAGRRFYTAYNGAARAVTQANALTSQDSPSVQPEETDELHPAARRALLKKSASSPKTRLRSSSVNSLLADKAKQPPLPVGGVLKTVQLQARSFHVLTAPQQQSEIPSVKPAVEEETLADPSVPPLSSAATPEQPSVVDSQSSPASAPSPSQPIETFLSPVPPLPPAEAAVPKSSQIEEDSEAPSSPSSGSSVSEPETVATSVSYEPTPFQTSPLGLKVKDALVDKDATAVYRAVKAIVDPPVGSTPDMSVHDYNTVLHAVGATRADGEPLKLTLQLYNAMLSRSVRPNIRTYLLLIEQFTTRDWEVHWAIERKTPSLARPAVRKELALLQAENNFSSAMKLFEAIVAMGGNEKVYAYLYRRLMRSCAVHANVDAALTVLTELEKRKLPDDTDTFRYLMQAFSNSNDYKGAELVFEKYARKEGARNLKASTEFNKTQVQMWNHMMDVYFRKGEPEKAIGLLDTMLKTEGTTPTPTSATYTTIIAGFIHTGDISSALLWFNRLAQQQETPGDDPFVPSLSGSEPPRPDRFACSLIVEALAKAHRIDDLNQLYACTQDLTYMGSSKKAVYESNLASLPTVSKEIGLGRLTFLREMFLENGTWNYPMHFVAFEVSRAYVGYGLLDEAVRLVDKLVGVQLRNATQAENSLGSVGVVEQLQNLVLSVVEETSMRLREGVAEQWSFGSALALAKVGTEKLGLGVTPEQGAWLLHLYGKAKEAGEAPAGVLDVAGWKIMLTAAVNVESAPVARVSAFAFQGVASLLEDMAESGVHLTEAVGDLETRQVAVALASQGLSLDLGREFFGRLGESYLAVYEVGVQAKLGELQSRLEEVRQQEVVRGGLLSPSPLAKSFGVQISESSGLSRAIEGVLTDRTLNSTAKADKAYAMFETSLAKDSNVPHVNTISKLIQLCGRMNQLERVREMYRVAQAILASVKGKAAERVRWQMWVNLEDNMIIGQAHAGDVEGAHAHRRRILDFAREVNQPFKPSADAYGALILHVKDTTDDATNAMVLWNEAMQVGVQPNLYLFNNIISKLARARKVDQALEMFRHMRASGLVPSSVTYGAVIGACVKVGDAASAEAWFKEMMEQRNFRPRVPPFNAMMQLYSTTRPDRQRALWYYEKMCSVGVRPTAHTYKLLLDIHGTVGAPDVEEMQNVWATLRADSSVRPAGEHFASLINVHGCVLKDLDQAIKVFESIPNEYGVGRDAVVYEALVNALVANKRTDLIREYMERMMVDGVHMTAYVANFLIKGYANVGDMDQARVIFESMLDSPMGVAAPNNHVPHKPQVEGNPAGVLDPVYREPSTWEAMIRGELGAGNRDRAAALLERLRARQYPEAVFNRIGGVLVDHSMPSLSL